MPNVYLMQANFTRGELSPRLLGRIDIEHYRAGLEICTNWIVMRQGGLRRRMGTRMVKEIKDSTVKTRLLPFNFGTPSNGVPQAYVIEAGNGYFRPLANGGPITIGLGAPTAVSKANPGVVTLAAHGLADSDPVFVTGLGGMTELNNREFAVTVVDANRFSIGVDTTGYTAFTSGGAIGKIVEVAAPWTAAQAAQLDYAQSADILTVTHRNVAPHDITRTSDTAWSIAQTDFKDGPYFDEPIGNTNGVTVSGTGAIHPVMTGMTAPSGTVTSSATSPVNTAWLVFDLNPASEALWPGSSGATAGYVEFAPGVSVVCNNYWITASPPYFETDPPSAWMFSGWDGAAWIELDRQDGQTAWAPGETRFFDFTNTVAYSKYQLKWLATVSTSATNSRFGETGWGYNGDFAPDLTFTFDNATNVNDGAGFGANDIGRPLRIRGADGKWRWVKITGVTSATVVTGRMYGYALPSLTKILHWRLGAWRKTFWPAKVGFYQSRKAFGRTAKEPFKVWLTKTLDFSDMGVSQPLADDDALALRLIAGNVDAIRWIAASDSLVAGTSDGVWTVSPVNNSAGFGASNAQALFKSRSGCAEIDPVFMQGVLIYANAYANALQEFIFDFATNSYLVPPLTTLSEHLFQGGIAAMAFQENPNPVLWIVLNGGGMVAMTYDRNEKIVGFARVQIAGGDDGADGFVESICSVPSAARNEIYVIVRRSMGGVTRRYIEMLAPEYDSGDVTAAVCLDSAMTYSGAATGTLTGLAHLAGMTVDALADGTVYRGIAVSATGALTLPGGATASTITVGLGYISLARTLRVGTMSQDGVHIGRRAMAQDVKFDVMNGLGLKVRGISSGTAYEVFHRDNAIDPASGAMTPRSGVFDAPFDSSWREDGQFEFLVDDPVPCTVRGAVIGVTGDP